MTISRYCQIKPNFLLGVSCGVIFFVGMSLYFQRIGRSPMETFKYGFDSPDVQANTAASPPISKKSVESDVVKTMSVDKKPAFRTDPFKTDPSKNFDKWIIVTSVAQKPTVDIQYLATLEGWKVIVVGDTKTPPDWSHPNCVYLGVKEQKELGYNIHDLLPYKTYSRKNFGYLYAVQHGAKIVYETDDDNRPLDFLKGFSLEPQMSGLMYATSDLVFNPYKHFGQPSIWPRGYKLPAITNVTHRRYRLSSSWDTPIIQEGVVNGDPDVDAIYRLTRKTIGIPLDIKFDPTAPNVIVPRGTFSPINAQNTLYHPLAFWSMMIPSSVNFRVVDIWRGYWGQRLMWEIGGRLGFVRPNALQIRNAHNYLVDAKDEDQVYFETDSLLEFLTKWTCPASFAFFECVKKLSFDMSENKFWKESDAQLTDAWLHDLKRMNYPEPKRIYRTFQELQEKFDKSEQSTDNDKSPSCSSGTVDKRVSASVTAPKESNVHVVYTPVDMEPSIPWVQTAKTSTPLTEQVVKISQACKGQDIQVDSSFIRNSVDKSFEYFHDVLTIIVFDSPNYENVQYIEAMYRSVFPSRIYCGTSPKSFEDTEKSLGLELSFIEAPLGEGCFRYLCALRAMEMGYNVTGYFVMGGDVLVNPWNFPKLDKSKLWATTGNQTVISYNPSNSDKAHNWDVPEIGFQAFKTTIAELRKESPKDVPSIKTFLRQSSDNTKSKYGVVAGPDNAYYIPKRFAATYLWYMKAFARNHIFHETATQVIFNGIEKKENIEQITGSSRPDLKVNDIWGEFNQDQHYLHPCKFSDEASRGKVCTAYIPMQIKKIYG